jgi:hypothetical protein
MNNLKTTPTSERRKGRSVAADILAISLAILVGSALIANAAGDKRKGHNPKKVQRKVVPQSGQLEAASGLKLKGCEFVSDGGHINCRFTVLDPVKAENVHKNQNKTKTSKLHNKKNKKDIVPVGGMEHVHALRPGQTDFMLFQNTDYALAHGDTIDLSIAGVTVNAVPVE